VEIVMARVMSIKHYKSIFSNNEGIRRVINGAAGLLATRDGEVFSVLGIAVRGAKIVETTSSLTHSPQKTRSLRPRLVICHASLI
jgi:hypothetical protein